MRRETSYSIVKVAVLAVPQPATAGSSDCIQRLEVAKLTFSPRLAVQVHTAFIAEHRAEVLPEAPPAPPRPLMMLAALSWLTAQSASLAARLPPASPWAAFPFASLGGGVSGGTGASPLLLQPLGPDGAPQGPPTLLRVRRSAAADATAATDATWEMSTDIPDGEGGASSSPSSWSSVVLGAWEESSREFRALVDGNSMQVLRPLPFDPSARQVLMPPSPPTPSLPLFHVQGNAYVTGIGGSGALEASTADATTVTVWAGGESVSVAIKDVPQHGQRAVLAAGRCLVTVGSSSGGI